MSNDTNNHVFTHNGVSIYKKADGSKYSSCKAVISKDCKDYSLLQFAIAKVESTKAQLDAFKHHIGWKQLSNAEKDALTKEEKRKHTLASKKIDNSKEMEAFNNARSDVSNIQQAIKESIANVVLDNLDFQKSIESILLDNGFVKVDGGYVYKITDEYGYFAVYGNNYKHHHVSHVHFYESEYKQFTDKETNKTKWYWTQGSNKASVCFEGFMTSTLQFKAHNFYINNSMQFEHMSSLIYTAQQVFNLMKQKEADVQTLELVDRAYEYELTA